MSFPAVFLTVIFFSVQPLASADGLLSPLLSPFADEVCEVSICGKGSCKFDSNSNNSLPFTCECEPGWKHLFPSSSFRFLPCVIPNCTVDFHCINVTAPAPEPSFSFHHSEHMFDVCDYVYCGEGSCVKMEDSHKCVCNNGAFNLLNATDLPCFPECFLGADCSLIGFGLEGNSSSTPRSIPGLPPGLSNGINQGTSVARDLFWLVALAYLLVMVLWM